MSEYYRILGVPENASEEQIKKAYRMLARKYHPDMNPAQDAAENFIRVTEAYEILMGDKQKPRTQTAPHKSAEDIAREKAKEYARMRYEEFKQRNDAFDLPMHSILWPRWVNYIILGFCLVVITDSIISPRIVTGMAVENPDGTFTACNRTFSAVDIPMVHDRMVSVAVTQMFAFVKYVVVDGEKYKVKDRVLQLIPVVCIIAILTLIIIFGNTRKLENKLLIKAFTAMFLLIFLYAFFTRGF